MTKLRHYTLLESMFVKWNILWAHFLNSSFSTIMSSWNCELTVLCERSHRGTSSIHSKHLIVSSRLSMYVPRFSLVISLLISSIRSAYCRTDSTPPCLMLSFIYISLVLPCLVLSCADMFSFVLLTRPHSWLFRPSLCITYIIASSQALLYASVTSKNTMFTVFCLCISLMVSFSTIRWSVVAALPLCPLTWFSVIFWIFFLWLCCWVSFQIVW